MSYLQYITNLPYFIQLSLYAFGEILAKKVLSLTNQLWVFVFISVIAVLGFTRWLSEALGLHVLVSYCFDILLTAGAFMFLYRRARADRIKLQDQIKALREPNKQPVCNGFIEDLPVALIIADNNGQITAINHLAREICGISQEEGPINIFHLSYDADTPLHFLSQTLQGKQVYHEQHYTCQREDDLKYYILSTAEILKNGEKPSGAMLIALPVSEQSFLSRHLSQRGKLAMIGELAAGTAHEIRNPLTSVRGLIQILSRRFADDDPTREYISVMLTEIDQINNIIKELLLLARRTTPNLSFASLPSVLDHVLLLVEAEATRRGIKVDKQYNHELPLIVLDEDQIKQVFWHLATNAIHAMPCGGKLTVAARYVDAEHAIEITFTDTGTGIPKEHMAQIFHPFFTTRPEGTGLGLPVSYQIVDNHGGKLSVKSVPGKGSSFIVKLPLVNCEKTKAS
ncbi:His Kinase A (phospho-acceptor) domain-containing protein [Desulforamulus putei DSM 12395]|uniref:histidine kinase n=2 Tax=Desulforamulus putei TaxID=74701 RepID=A0A1M4SZY6_9FIRM|nr:His Kinase A (phospho-acceptor) domain-containing protein [Desulforamulus putei DSM 12395]